MVSAKKHGNTEAGPGKRNKGIEIATDKPSSFFSVVFEVALLDGFAVGLAAGFLAGARLAATGFALCLLLFAGVFSFSLSHLFSFSASFSAAVPFFCFPLSLSLSLSFPSSSFISWSLSVASSLVLVGRAGVF